MRAYEEWFPEAVCRIEPAKTEFIKKSKSVKQYCEECPVKGECLEYAILYSEHGVWGGTTDVERERVIEGSPRLVLILTQEAQKLGILEHRYAIAQYFETLQKARGIRNVQRHSPIVSDVAPPQVEEELLEPPEGWSIQQEFEHEANDPGLCA